MTWPAGYTVLPIDADQSESFATAISRDGTTVVGEQFSSGTNTACYWTQGNPPVSIVLNGADSSAGCVSADGSIIFGTVEDLDTFESIAFKWTQADGLFSLGTPAGQAQSLCNGVSDDGTIVAGIGDNNGSYYWTLGTGWISIGVLPGGSSTRALAISGDGTVIVGFSDNGAGQQFAYRWTQGSGMVAIPNTLGGIVAQANGVSIDGSAIVGSATDGDGNYHAFRWTQGSGMVSLGVLPGETTSQGRAISSDGNTIVGFGDFGETAFVWTNATGKVALPILSGQYDVNGISGDASTIIGDAGTLPWVYTAPPAGQLELVTLLPMDQPTDVFAVVNNLAAGFNSIFSQLTISGWFCNEVHIQGPYGLDTPSFEMDFSPTFASFVFKDVFGTVLFQASFTNGGPSQNPYNICFSVQTGTSNTVGLIWPIGGAATRLKSLGGGNISIPSQASADGSILVGQCSINGDAGHAVKWNGSVITELADFPDRSQASLCSQDGSIILGTAFTPDFSTDNTILWTSGGSTGSVLTPFTGYTVAAGSALFFRGMSDDGSVITGSCNNGGAGVPTLWTNGVPALLPDAALSGLDSIVVSADGCSSNGSSLIFGNGIGQGFIYINLEVGVYWIGGTEYSLADTGHVFTLLGTSTNCCNAAGTIIYGSIATNHTPGNVFVPVYWDDLTGAQTIHHIDIPAPYTFWRIVYCSDTGTVSVGNAQSGGVFAAVKATATSAVLLPDLGFGSQAIACSHDGSIVVGNVTDVDGFSVPVYWDAANVMHVLPYPADEGNYSNGQVTGISRDGTMAFGDATLQAYSFRGNGQPWIASDVIQTVGNVNNGLG